MKILLFKLFVSLTILLYNPIIISGEYFSTKTSYFKVGNLKDKIQIPENCSPVKIWSLIRHGTRNPGDDDIIDMAEKLPIIKEKILDAYDSRKGKLSPEDVDRFREWSFNLTVDDESLLTASGRREQVELARKLKLDFPTLLNQTYSKEKFEFRHTIKKRTLQSAQGFAEGLFPNVDDIFMYPPEETEYLLRYYDYCPKWIDSVDENSTTYRERDLFLNGPEMKTVREKVIDTLGLSNEDISLNDVELMYDMCRFDKAWNPEKISAAWCVGFDTDDLKVLEYAEELKYWYKNGYGSQLNTVTACPLMKNLVNIFTRNEEESSNLPVAYFYFSHSEAVLPFLSLLGLYKDKEILKHDNYRQVQDRHYRTSKIGTFSNNVVFVDLKCQEKNYVMTLHQGKVVKMPECSSEYCEMEEFKSIYQSAISCPIEEICSVPNFGSRLLSFSILPILIFIITIIYVFK